MVMKARDVLKRLKADGWVLVNVVGSHHQYAHPTKPGRVTVSFDQGGVEIGGGTLKSIFKQAGWNQ